MYLEIGLILLVIVLISLVIICIPILLQIWRILKHVRLTLETLNQSLPTILKNIEEITTNVNSSTVNLHKRIQDLSNTADRIQFMINDIMDNIQCFVPNVMNLPIFQTIRNVTAVIKGIRVFMEVLFNKAKV